MRATANLSVKGTRYYRASELFQKGSLYSGLPIRMEHQPHNPHDSNAVAFKIRSNGAMLGHVARDLAPKYARLLKEDMIIGAKIFSIKRDGADINIDVQVAYELSDNALSEKHRSRLWRSSMSMPMGPGIYAITNNVTGRQYIGSSYNLKDRARDHIKQLSQGCHANHLLQSDFSGLGPNQFEVRVLESPVRPSETAILEEKHIASLLLSGAKLYNLTGDGQGIGYRPTRHIRSESVSDRLIHQPLEEEQRLRDRTLAEKKKIVADYFDPKLEAMLPLDSFWVYLVTCFFGALAICAIFFPDTIKGVGLVVSVITAIVVAPILIDYRTRKVQRSDSFQQLLKERSKQLSAIESEHQASRNL
ncbi:group I intron endonuclease [Marinobacter daqiaonensis]|uniref:Group I intron endonuclease n=1 Tax=Marinobacter daqiaonensis TaxID=650891 RepID=A0A1I6HSP1_9GAMM|nr:HIRAN domain-containing protein [Marinobacter daqiaonensis]SFR57455.1 group I intron endonuclease [Marinobacter daqiaonensis]